MSDMLFSHFGGFIVLSVLFQGAPSLDFGILETSLTQAFHQNALIELTNLTENRVTTTTATINAISNAALETENASSARTVASLDDINLGRSNFSILQDAFST